MFEEKNMERCMVFFYLRNSKMLYKSSNFTKLMYMYGFFKGKRQTKVSTKAATVLEAISLTDQPNRCWGHKHCIE